MPAGLRLEPPATLASIPAPRRRIDAVGVVKEFFTMHDGRKLVTDRWVRKTVPGKVRVSHSVVFWYYDDVVKWLASRQEKAS